MNRLQNRTRIEKAGNEIENEPKRKRRLWPWLVLLAVTLLAIYGYRQAVLAWEDMVRTWRDLVQLFWWIIPDRQP